MKKLISKLKNKRVLGIAATAIVFVIAALVVINLSSSKTVSVAELAFTYPANWESLSADTTKLVVLEINSSSTLRAEYFEKIYADIYYPVEQFSNDFLDTLEADDPTAESVEMTPFTLNGMPATKLIYVAKATDESEYVVQIVNVELNGNIYSFTYSNTADNFDIELPHVDKVIESVRIVPSEV